MSVDAQIIKRAVQILKQGSPIVFPTDTVYGLGVAVGSATGVEELYRIKQRDEGKPIAWLVDHVDSLNKYGSDVPDYAHMLARKYWPGSLTLVIKASGLVPASFKSSQNTIALRMPNDETALALISILGAPIATTSANISGDVDPSTFRDLEDAIMQEVAFAIDDGQEHLGIASTVIDCTGLSPNIIREGSIKKNEIDDILTL